MQDPWNRCDRTLHLRNDTDRSGATARDLRAPRLRHAQADCHDALGLGTEFDGVRSIASLVPIKEREILILGRPGADESSLAPAIARAVAAYRRAGVVSYNMALYLPPLSPDGEDWRRFPPLARLVDRGDPANKTSDIGAMELYAASVVAADPFRLAEALRA